MSLKKFFLNSFLAAVLKHDIQSIAHPAALESIREVVEDPINSRLFLWMIRCFPTTLCVIFNILRIKLDQRYYPPFSHYPHGKLYLVDSMSFACSSISVLTLGLTILIYPSTVVLSMSGIRKLLNVGAAHAYTRKFGLFI